MVPAGTGRVWRGAGCVRACACVLTIEEDRGLLFFEARESSATTHRLKTSSVSSSVQ